MYQIYQEIAQGNAFILKELLTINYMHIRGAVRASAKFPEECENKGMIIV